MVSLEELKSGKTSLKRRPTGTKPEPSVALGAMNLPEVPTSTRSNNAKPNIPLPTISLHTLVSARTSLHRVSAPRQFGVQSVSPTATSSSASAQQDPISLPTFLKRKEHFEKQGNQVTKSLPLSTTATVCVGEGDRTQSFTVDIKTLRSSPQFRDELGQGLLDLVLPDHDPLAFKLFLDFCQDPQEPIKYQGGRYSTEPWMTSSTDACILAVALKARRFEKYALSQFIQNCAIIVTGPWKQIEECTHSDAAISKFSKHWIAWNISLSNWWSHEFVGLDAAASTEQVTSETRDPRIFDLDHWYQACGNDFNALCQHNPIHRKQQQQKEAKNSRAAPPEWGADSERRVNHRFKNYARTQWQ